MRASSSRSGGAPPAIARDSAHPQPGYGAGSLAGEDRPPDDSARAARRADLRQGGAHARGRRSRRAPRRARRAGGAGRRPVSRPRREPGARASAGSPPALRAAAPRRPSAARRRLPPARARADPARPAAEGERARGWSTTRTRRRRSRCGRMHPDRPAARARSALGWRRPSGCAARPPTGSSPRRPRSPAASRAARPSSCATSRPPRRPSASSAARMPSGRRTSSSRRRHRDPRRARDGGRDRARREPRPASCSPGPSTPGSTSTGERVDLRGWLPRDGVADVLREARVGLLVLHPVAAHLESLPIKLFEYMAAGIPVVASDFPLWRELVGERGRPGRPARRGRDRGGDRRPARRPGRGRGDGARRGREAVATRFSLGGRGRAAAQPVRAPRTLGTIPRAKRRARVARRARSRRWRRPRRRKPRARRA